MPKVVRVHFEGRFGNNLFQYAIGRALADIWGAELQTPEWIGQQIFEDAGSQPMQPYCGGGHGTFIQELPPFDAPVEIINLGGFWQNTMLMRIYSREQVKRWFKLKPEFTLQQDGLEYVAYHLRRGDMAENPKEWATINRDAYGVAILNYGYSDMSLVEVSEELPHNNAQLPEHLQFLVDWQILMHAKVLFRANSSFSWWAGTLGDGLVYSPDVCNQYGAINAQFVRGNHCAFTSGKDSPDIDLINETEWANHWLHESEDKWFFSTPDQKELGPFESRQAAVVELYRYAFANEM